MTNSHVAALNTATEQIGTVGSLFVTPRTKQQRSVTLPCAQLQNNEQAQDLSPVSMVVFSNTLSFFRTENGKTFLNPLLAQNSAKSQLFSMHLPHIWLDIFRRLSYYITKNAHTLSNTPPAKKQCYLSIDGN